jgi:hypothetical protein
MQNAVDECKPFERGNLSAKYVEARTLDSSGRMPADYAERLKMDNNLNAVFVVYSYQTPIGWCVIDNQTQNPLEWVIPDVTYSVSTTHHQSLLSVMTANKGFYSQF